MGELSEKEKYMGELSNNFKSITKQEISYIFTELDKKGVDWQKIDFFAFGKDCNYEMLVQNIFMEYGLEVPYPETQNETQTQNQKINVFKNDMGFWDEMIPSLKSVAVVGETGSGKTALVYRILERFRKKLPERQIYVFKHPKPELILKLGFKQLFSLEELSDMRNCVVWIDEPQLHLTYYANNGNPELAKLLSLARQRDITLILSTSISQYITKTLEGQIDCYCIKDCDYDVVKQGSRIRTIIRQNSLFTPDAFKLKPNEYLFYCRKFYDKQGRYKFELPKFWNDDYSKPYKE